MSLSIGNKLSLSLAVIILMLLVISSPKPAEASTCSFYVGFQYDIPNLEYPGGKFLAKENIGTKQVTLKAYTPKPNESGSVTLNVYSDMNTNNAPLYSSTVTFTGDAPTQVVHIPIQDDTILNEGIREQFIQLSNPSSNVCFYEEDGWREAFLYILDNEPPTLRVTPSETSYDLAEGGKKTFEIKRLGDLTLPVAYQITDTPITAQSSDYSISSNGGSFPTEIYQDYVRDWLNSQVQYVSVTALADTETEATETFQMHIASANAQIDGPSTVDFRIMGVNTCSFYVGFQYDIPNMDYPGGKFLAKENIGTKQVTLRAYTPQPNESGSVVLKVYSDMNTNNAPLYSTTVTFTGNAPTQVVHIPIQDDTILNEDIRELFIQLSNPSPNVCFYEEDGWREAFLYILDDEPPTLKVTPSEASHDLAEGESKTFEIRRLGDLTLPVTYQITDTPITAQSSDYSISPTEGSFPTQIDGDYVRDWLNSQVEYVTVSALADTAVESTETFQMHIASPNAQINGPSTVDFRIIGNDGGSSATIQLEQSAYATWEYINVLPVKLTRTGNLTQEVSVWVSTVNGSAKRDKDFGFEPVRITFAPGQLSANLNLYIIDDVFWEGNETFTLQLSDAQGGAVLGTVQQATVTIYDNEWRTQ